MIRISSSRRRRGAALALSLGTFGAVGLFSGGVSAATSVETYSISGTLVIGPPPALTLPGGSTFSFTWDDTTGEISNGHTSIPAFDRGAATGPAVTITLTDAAPGTGNLDPATGEGSITLTLAVHLSIPSLSSECDLSAPITMSLSTSNAGGSPVVGDPPSGVLTASGASVAGVASSPTCEAAASINTLVDLPTSATEFTLAASRTASVTTTSTTVETTTTTTEAPTTTEVTATTEVSTTAASTAAPPVASTLPATGRRSTVPTSAAAALLVGLGLAALILVRRGEHDVAS